MSSIAIPVAFSRFIGAASWLPKTTRPRSSLSSTPQLQLILLSDLTLSLALKTPGHSVRAEPFCSKLAHCDPTAQS